MSEKGRKKRLVRWTLKGAKLSPSGMPFCEYMYAIPLFHTKNGAKCYCAMWHIKKEAIVKVRITIEEITAQSKKEGR